VAEVNGYAVDGDRNSDSFMILTLSCLQYTISKRHITSCIDSVLDISILVKYYVILNIIHYTIEY
jgi:hypothetical protein